MARAIHGHVGIVGGGTAGYFAALALRRWFPELRVTLIESSKIPIIGVGEATTPPLVAFLHNFLGLDVQELYAAVRPTWKLGIHFAWGARPEGFDYPFSWGQITEAHAYDGSVERASMGAMLMANQRAPIMKSDDGEVVSALDQLRFAYHLDNQPFVQFLQRCARRAGVEHVDAVVTGAELGPGVDGEPHVTRLDLEGGGTLAFDFYVDCTGFRSLLLEKTLGSGFVDYKGSLFCDSAVVADVPHDGTVKVSTLAETMDSGWCWGIPMVDCDHRGYVYSSQFATPDQAAEEMVRKNPGIGRPWHLTFRSGRHEQFWRGNVAAIGNAYGFVEPLESTALHMAIIEVHVLVRMLDAGRVGAPDHDRHVVNQRLGAHWDYLRWFLAIHYRFNQRLDTPFWRACRAQVDISGIADTVEDFQRNGPLSGRGWKAPPDAIFGAGGLDILLLGQDVPTVTGAPAMDRTTWVELCAKREAAVARAMPYAEALPLLTSRPDLLHNLIHAPRSWTRDLANVLES